MLQCQNTLDTLVKDVLQIVENDNTFVLSTQKYHNLHPSIVSYSTYFTYAVHTFNISGDIFVLSFDAQIYKCVFFVCGLMVLYKPLK